MYQKVQELCKQKHSPPYRLHNSQRIVRSLWKRIRSGKDGQSTYKICTTVTEAKTEVEYFDEGPDIIKEEMRHALKKNESRKGSRT